MANCVADTARRHDSRLAATSHARPDPAAGVGSARQNGCVSNPELITAVDLDQWSGTLAAQTTLPILVRRLILATTPVGEITMRARQGALLPGWDGIVRSDVTDAHVPLGTSGWELGTSKDPREKAQSDLRSGARTRWAWT